MKMSANEENTLTTVIFVEEYSVEVRVLIEFTVERELTGQPDPKDPFSEGSVLAPVIDSLTFILPEELLVADDSELEILHTEKYYKEYEKALREAWESGAFNKEADND